MEIRELRAIVSKFIVSLSVENSSKFEAIIDIDLRKIWVTETQSSCFKISFSWGFSHSSINLDKSKRLCLLKMSITYRTFYHWKDDSLNQCKTTSTCYHEA